MKVFNPSVLALLLMPLIAATSACGPELIGPLPSIDPAPSESATQTPRARQNGPFSLHSEEFSCGTPLSDEFSCIRQGCAQVGGVFDEASKECFCSRGSFRMLGRLAKCEIPTLSDNVIVGERGNSHLSLRYSPSYPDVPFSFTQRDAEHVSLSWVRSTRLHYGRLLTSNDGEHGLGLTSITGHPSDLSDTYEYVSQVDYRNDGLINRFFSEQTLHLAEDQWLATSLIRKPRNEQRLASAAAPRTTNGIRQPHEEEILFGLRTLNGHRSLPSLTIVFSSRSAGCAAGCELDYVLRDWSPSSVEGYDARIVYKKEYLWGAFSGERIEVEARLSTDPTKTHLGAIVAFLPNGEVSVVGVHHPLFGTYEFEQWQFFDHLGVNLREAK